MGAKYRAVSDAVINDLSVMELEDLADLVAEVLLVKRRRRYSPIDDDDDEFDGWLDDIYDDEAPPITPRKVMPRYRNPLDLSQTWSGRGVKPRWVVEQIAQGRSLEDFRLDADGRFIVSQSEK